MRRAAGSTANPVIAPDLTRSRKRLVFYVTASKLAKNYTSDDRESQTWLQECDQKTNGISATSGLVSVAYLRYVELQWLGRFKISTIGREIGYCWSIEKEQVLPSAVLQLGQHQTPDCRCSVLFGKGNVRVKSPNGRFLAR